MRYRILIVACVCLIASVAGTWLYAEEQPRPKYGPTATRLFRARTFIQQQPASDYWALSPYYVSQPNDSSCSVATLTMLVNGLRVEQQFAANQQLATPESLLALVNRKLWRDKVTDDGPGLTLDELADVTRKVLDASGLQAVQVEVIRLPDDANAAEARLHELLVENEQSSRDFLVANFLQSELTGDPEGAVGHVAPIAAFDAATGRVLILDPDRRWYEPYWVSKKSLLNAVTTKDVDSGRMRGLLRVSRLE